MKRYFQLLFLFLNISSLTAQDFKVVGYFPSYRFEIIDNIDFTKISHLNLAFLNPDIDGNLSIGDQEIDPIIDHAKTVNPDIQIFISIGGGGWTEELQQAYDKFLLPENKSEFSHLLLEYVLKHNLDGIDVDLEWDMVNEYYSPFILDLADSLKSKGKQITAALPGTFRYQDVSQEALQSFDFVNLMVYDNTGPWRPNDPGPHSSREFARESIDYWRNQGLADEKMTLGVPFYGYDFTNQSNVTAFTFGTLVSENKHYAFSDQVGEKYYNGIPTIQYKTMYALDEELSGIMIWELGQDAFGSISEFSLLSAIDYVIKTGTVLVTGLEDEITDQIKIFPNPFHDNLTISSTKDLKNIDIRLIDLQGKEYFVKQSISSNSEISMNYSNLKSGLYILGYVLNGESHHEKVLKLN